MWKTQNIDTSNDQYQNNFLKPNNVKAIKPSADVKAKKINVCFNKNGNGHSSSETELHIVKKKKKRAEVKKLVKFFKNILILGKNYH